MYLLQFSGLLVAAIVAVSWVQPTSGQDQVPPGEPQSVTQGPGLGSSQNQNVDHVSTQSDAEQKIWANAIALEMEKVATPRPMTHDLIKNVLMGLETQVHKVVVTELKEDTFYAVIWLERSGEVISIDSRPSDALALALRVDCPIFVDDVVLKTSKLAANMSDRVTSEELRKWLEGLNDEDLGKYKM